MSACDEQLLGAYLDGELPPAQRVQVEGHLRECPTCAQQLELMREASKMLRDYPFADLTDDERTRLHQAVDSALDLPVLRIGGTLGLIAASILIVGLAWLRAIPASSPAQNRSVATATTPAEPWERVAMTLRPDYLPQTADSTDQMQLADNVTNFMLGGLNK